ncbi:hypothetical protein F2Q70_00045569 [Brassica cretica]|uniref:Uncharacterized protein n=1 Tax=Brassica cretica TaxID=69181 RepID=A0A8S9KD08_BRACR|nr:hypothetical protein F2Q70_00045569 [Brassica cretica]KAF3520698.1 hypothetical protein DY000_02064124 [Brassica cretica]
MVHHRRVLIFVTSAVDSEKENLRATLAVIHLSDLKAVRCKAVVQSRLWRTVDVDTMGRML